MIYGILGAVLCIAAATVLLRRFSPVGKMKRELLMRLVAINEYRGLDATEFGREQLVKQLSAAIARAGSLEPASFPAGKLARAWKKEEFGPMLWMLDHDANASQGGDPKKYRQLGELALLSDSMELVDRALAYLESVAPDDFATRNLRGKTLLRRGKTDAAVAVWTAMHVAAEGENREYAEIARCNRDVATALEGKLRMSQDASRRSESTRKAQNRLKGVPPDREDILDKADVETLVNLLDMENRQELIDDMFRAAIDPVPFFADNRERLRDAGFNEAYDMLYAALLPQELERQGRTAEIDWKEDPEEIAGCVEKISRGKYPHILTESDDLPALEALKLAGERVRDGGDTMLSIASGGDYYIILIVPDEKTAAIIAAADRCGIKINLMADEP